MTFIAWWLSILLFSPSLSLSKPPNYKYKSVVMVVLGNLATGRRIAAIYYLSIIATTSERPTRGVLDSNYCFTHLPFPPSLFLAFAPSLSDLPYLKKVAAAHRIHHMDQFEGKPFGLFLGPQELEQAGLEGELTRVLSSQNEVASRAQHNAGASTAIVQK